LRQCWQRQRQQRWLHEAACGSPSELQAARQCRGSGVHGQALFMICFLAIPHDPPGPNPRSVGMHGANGKGAANACVNGCRRSMTTSSSQFCLHVQGKRAGHSRQLGVPFMLTLAGGWVQAVQTAGPAASTPPPPGSSTHHHRPLTRQAPGANWLTAALCPAATK
jgi:hypothetical protein